jgi:hypothetical protein
LSFIKAETNLDLRGCTKITDVSTLSGVSTLKLSNCHLITDVSALSGVSTLDLRYCRLITDVSAMFYPLFNKLQEKSIYFPKIMDADVYLDFITKNLNNDELKNAYQDFTKTFDIKSFEWMYYYVYIILLNDFESIINKELYKKIVC